MNDMGLYPYFYKNYFDPRTNEFTFDLEKADVKCMLCNLKYHPNGRTEKTRADIAKFELKKRKVPKWIPVPQEEPIMDIRCEEDAPVITEVLYEQLQKRKVMVPNGYEAGGLSVGPVRAVTREVTKIENEKEVTYDETTLYTERLGVSWGLQLNEDGDPKYPDKSTLTVGTIVYYLNKGKRAHSPLMSYAKAPGCEGYTSQLGAFNVIHSVDGIFNLGVDKDLNEKLAAHPEWEVAWSEDRAFANRMNATLLNIVDDAASTYKGG